MLAKGETFSLFFMAIKLGVPAIEQGVACWESYE